MRKILESAKAIAALVGAILTSVIMTLPDVPLWLAVVSSVVTAIAVYVIPNAEKAVEDSGDHAAE